MSYTVRDRMRAELKRLLQSADDEGVVQLLWAVDALQSKNVREARTVLLDVPADAEPVERFGRHAIYEWEREDLVNELFSTSKRPEARVNPAGLNYRLHSDALRLAGILRALQNAEDGISLEVSPVFDEMKRIAARQFDWQRGFLNIPQFYRTAFVYGQGESAAYFEASNGISVDLFSMVGVALSGFFASQPAMGVGADWSPVRVGATSVEAALGLLCVTDVEARRMAVALRRGAGHSAYKPSFLRQRPCIVFGGARIRAPLPALILERVTSGLYYDVVKGGGPVRADYGRRFEQYALRLLRASLPGLQFDPERSYVLSRNRLETPDILCRDGDAVVAAIECKATRMSFAAKFSDAPLDDRGYGEIVKAVVQIWRYFSHCRRNVLPDSLAGDAVGIVLAMDGWLTMGMALHDDVLAQARRTAIASGMCEEDFRPIAFVAIADLEIALQTATKTSFVAAVKEATLDDRKGYMFFSVHEAVAEQSAEARPYPFCDHLGELLPWWSELNERAEPSDPHGNSGVER